VPLDDLVVRVNDDLVVRVNERNDEKVKGSNFTLKKKQGLFQNAKERCIHQIYSMEFLSNYQISVYFD
jgi:hypothetical protein